MRLATRDLRACALLVPLLALWAGPAAAHELRGAAMDLDIGERVVDIELQIVPRDLELAVPDPTPERVRAYVREHLGARTKSAPLALEVASAEVARVGDGDAWVVRARFEAPAEGNVRWFELRYDGVFREVPNHSVFVFVRHDLQTGLLEGEPQLVGTLRAGSATLVVDRTAGSAGRGFLAAFLLGTRHIAEGTDHLLFLLMLLLPAPLLAAGRRWGGARDVRASVRGTIAIVTAFTIGHSVTLIVATLRGPLLAERPVETLVAVSILVSAIHAFRPLLARKEAFVAGAFGLVHGLAFASVLTRFGLDSRTLVLSLLGFNVGVEVMQLVVVGLTMPWLILARRSPAYAVLRIAGAALGAVAALGWIAERAFEVTTPIPGLVEGLASHAPWIGVGLAVVGLALNARGNRA